MLFFGYQTALGKLFLVEENSKITHLCFEKKDFMRAGLCQQTPLLDDTYRQIKEYLAGKRKIFDVPLTLQGTPFQQKVWRALLDIPYGTTVSYKDIAAKIGNDKAYRAVGMANNQNPIPILVPCHRVIGSNGKLVGYAGGLATKHRLLKIESINK